MLKYTVNKLFYGLLVLWGVVTLIFFIFNLQAGNAARMMGGQHATPEVIASIENELGLNLPAFQRYLLYLNDLSPVSFHRGDATAKHLLWDEAKYRGICLLRWQDGSKIVALKLPYLRRSYQSRRAVSTIIAETLPNTMLLAGVSILLALLLGLLFGIGSALNKGKVFDHFAFFFSVAGMSTPSFFMAILIAWLGGYLWYQTVNLPWLPVVFAGIGLAIAFFARRTKKANFWVRALNWGLAGLVTGLLIWMLDGAMRYLLGVGIVPGTDQYILLPGTGLNMSGSLIEVDAFEGEQIKLSNLILPVLTLGIRPLAVVAQLSRNSMLEVLSMDYIRTARAKGISSLRIVLKHALKNALMPVVTVVSGWFASLLAGAVFIEYVFGWKGLGWEIFISLEKDDLPVVMGAVTVIASIFVLINIVVDILYGILDPKVSAK